MTQQYIKLLINSLCQQFATQINNSDISHGKYRDLLKQFPEKIKKQAEKSLETFEHVDTLKLLTVIAVKNDYLQSISELNAAFQQCTMMERAKITQAQLAPFQVDQFARQLALSPGIILAYENIIGQKSKI